MIRMERDVYFKKCSGWDEKQAREAIADDLSLLALLMPTGP